MPAAIAAKKITENTNGGMHRLVSLLLSIRPDAPIRPVAPPSFSQFATALERSDGTSFVAIINAFQANSWAAQARPWLPRSESGIRLGLKMAQAGASRFGASRTILL